MVVRLPIVRATLLGALLSTSSIVTAQDRRPAPADGAANAAIGNPDIIVTAQRKDTALSKTPVAVAVLSADTLVKAQVHTEQDLRQLAPGLQINSNFDQVTDTPKFAGNIYADITVPLIQSVNIMIHGDVYH